MHIVVTGAQGFIGRTLVHTLLSAGLPGGTPASMLRVTAVDMSPGSLSPNPALLEIQGSFASPSVLQEVLKQPVDLLFHLAAVPSGRSESDPHLGLDVNVQGTIRLLDALKAQGNCPRLVFASSIAVYGKPQVPLVHDDTLPAPTLSYGAHKVIGEVLVNDYTRRGWVNGNSLRLPGIVARPPEPNGAVSIFLSDLIRELAAGRPFTCPTSADAETWLMSVRCCIRNLLHAATGKFGARHTWMPPARHVRLGDLVDAIGVHSNNPEVHKLVTWAPDEWVQFNFGSYPPLKLPEAEAAGFHADTSLEQLVADALHD